MLLKTITTIAGVLLLNLNVGQSHALELSPSIEKNKDKVIQWRRHFHQNPELSNREFKTSAYIASYLESLGLQVQTKVAHTGVVAILDSGKPGPVVALRADMDGLPVTEKNDLPFKSTAKAIYKDKEVGVMHACGHDTHMAILMGAATVLVENKDKLKGKVKFIFQPAEEGPPAGEEGGAPMMVKEGVLKSPEVDAIFGLHIRAYADVGTIGYRMGGIMAAVDPFKIVVKGKQAHGAYPWKSVDPIVTAAQIVMGLQTIVSREIRLIDNAAVVSVGSIHGGNRSNIIPEQVELIGTIRTLNPEAKALVKEAVVRKAKGIAASMNATVDIELPYKYSYPVTYNDKSLMTKMLPTLHKVAGSENVVNSTAVTGAEDFSFYQQQVPGVFLFLGGKPKHWTQQQAPAHHTPEFYIDEQALELGVKVMSQLALDYLNQH